MNDPVSLKDFMPLIRELFAEGKTVTLTASGNSMRPLLHHGRDSVILAPCEAPEKLKKRDVPLYERADGRFVLHRIVKVKNGRFTMCGDRQTELETGVLPQSVAAVAVGFVRNGKKISCKSPLYRLYAFLWCAVRPIRPSLFKLKAALNKVFKKGGVKAS